jgi:hypothetical protein
VDCRLQILHCLIVAFSADCSPTFHEVNQKNASSIPKTYCMTFRGLGIFLATEKQDVSTTLNLFSILGCHDAPMYCHQSQSCPEIHHSCYTNMSTTAMNFLLAYFSEWKWNFQFLRFVCLCLDGSMKDRIQSNSVMSSKGPEKLHH